MTDQETIQQLKEQVKAMRKERDRFERMLYDERQHLGTQHEPFYVRMRAIVRSITEGTDKQVRSLRSHLPPPSDIDYLWDTDWERLNNLVPQLRKLANEIEDLDRQRGLTVNTSVVEALPYTILKGD